jgi:hypothetical protein
MVCGDDIIILKKNTEAETHASKEAVLKINAEKN